MLAKESRLPFDTGPMRALSYDLDVAGGPADAEAARGLLAQALRVARTARVDSPVFQLVEGFGGPTIDIERLRTDSFRDRIDYSIEVKGELASARGRPREERVAALDAIRQRLQPIADLDAGIAIDMFLSYRAVGAFDSVIALAGEMAEPVRRTTLVQEQLGFALNRAGRSLEAERILRDLVEERGASSETFGILARVYKDRWARAREAGSTVMAEGLLRLAIDTYLAGFEADWRDAYPGINAVTLMDISEPPDPRRIQLAPVVKYSAQRRVESGKPDYWDHATLFEAAVLDGDENVARAALGQALAVVRESWEPDTTLNNLRIILEARRRRHAVEGWHAEVERALEAAAAQ